MVTSQTKHKRVAPPPISRSMYLDYRFVLTGRLEKLLNFCHRHVMSRCQDNSGGYGGSSSTKKVPKPCTHQMTTALALVVGTGRWTRWQPSRPWWRGRKERRPPGSLLVATHFVRDLSMLVVEAMEGLDEGHGNQRVSMKAMASKIRSFGSQENQFYAYLRAPNFFGLISNSQQNTLVSRRIGTDAPLKTSRSFFK